MHTVAPNARERVHPDPPGGSRCTRSGRGEDGSGPISALLGLVVFLSFLLLAVQVLGHLYATSAVTAASFDAARLVAGEEQVATDVAEQHARVLLGDYGRRPDLRFDWSASTADEVVLRVEGPTPAVLVEAVVSAAGLDAIRREVHVRREAFR